MFQRKPTNNDASLACYSIFRGFLNAIDSLDNQCSNRCNTVHKHTVQSFLNYNSSICYNFYLCYLFTLQRDKVLGLPYFSYLTKSIFSLALQRWQLLSFFDTLLPFWSETLLTPTIWLKLLIINKSLVNMETFNTE